MESLSRQKSFHWNCSDQPQMRSSWCGNHTGNQPTCPFQRVWWSQTLWWWVRSQTWVGAPTWSTCWPCGSFRRTAFCTCLVSRAIQCYSGPCPWLETFRHAQPCPTSVSRRAAVARFWWACAGSAIAVPACAHPSSPVWTRVCATTLRPSAPTALPHS